MIRTCLTFITTWLSLSDFWCLIWWHQWWVGAAYLQLYLNMFLFCIRLSCLNFTIFIFIFTLYHHHYHHHYQYYHYHTGLSRHCIRANAGLSWRCAGFWHPWGHVPAILLGLHEERLHCTVQNDEVSAGILYIYIYMCILCVCMCACVNVCICVCIGRHAIQYQVFLVIISSYMSHLTHIIAIVSLFI